MKLRILLIILCAISFQSVSAQEHADKIRNIRKAINLHDKAVHVLHDWMRDPYIVKGPDGYFYLTATQNGAERFDSREIHDHGLPVYRSKDLARWEFLGYPYTIADAGNYEDYFKMGSQHSPDPFNSTDVSALRLWAPELHFIDGRWAIVHTSSGRYSNMLLTEGDKIEPPFYMWDEKFGNQHDPSIFQDDDGTCWLVTGCTNIQQLNDDLTGFVGERIPIGASNRSMGHEGAYILKFEDKYILFATGWSTDNMRKGTYNLYYAVADNVQGPYGPRKFAGRYLGHGIPFQDHKGRWWNTAFWNANVPELTREEARTRDLSDDAYTIVKQGLTLVPMVIEQHDGKVVVYAKDPDYRYPGPEEVQNFNSSR
jgi:xylan 1,4-beta-xylosidase